MAYASEIAKDSTSAQTFVLLEPKRRLLASEFTLHSGSVYKVTIPEFVASVAVLGTALTEGTSASLSAGYFYYDFDTSILYIRKADSSAPTDANYICAGLELYFSEADAIWYRRPTDSSYRAVQWNGIISSKISVRRSISNLMQGFYPSEATALRVLFVPEMLQKVLYDCSFFLTSVTVWYQYGSLSTSNFKKVFSGVTENFNIDEGEEFVSWALHDKIRNLDQPIRYSDGINYINDVYPGVSGELINQPLRMIYGNCRYLAATYVGQVGGLHTFIFGKNESGDMGAYRTLTIVSRPDDFTTVFSSGDWNQIPGDFGKIYMNQHGVGGHAGNEAYLRVTKSSTPNVTHGSLVATSWNTGDTFRFAKNAFVVMRGPIDEGTAAGTELKPGQDFTPYTDGDVWGIQLTGGAAGSGLEIWGWCNGQSTYPTINGSNFGSIPAAYDCVGNSVVVLYDFLKRIAGMAESDIDTDSFQAAETYGLDMVDCKIPDTIGSDFPTYKEVIIRLLQTSLCVGFFNDAGKFVIKPIAQITGEDPDHEIDETDIQNGSVSHSFDNTDVGNVRAHFLSSDLGFTDASYLSDPPDAISIYGSGHVREDRGGSSFNVYISGGDKEYDIYPYASEYPNGSYNGGAGLAGGSTSEISTWLSKVAEIFSQRSGRLKLDVRHPFIDMELYDIAEITRAIIPGTTYDADTDQTKNYRVVEIEKFPDSISIVLDDQKAIEESAVW